MATVTIHPPKTPVTRGSNGIAKATLPNVCKMPGPPAPFVPSPLPNIAKSALSPQGYSTTVKIEGNAVAIRGASFASMGDVASKATGGGLLSMNTHGPAKFITPGSLTVKIEGKSVHLLSEPMLNNCGPSGSPPNTGATMMGLDQDDVKAWDTKLQRYVNECDQEEDAKNPKMAADCDGDSGEMMWDKKTQTMVPKPNKVKMGELKEKCVYRKMGFDTPETGPTPEQSRSNAKGTVVIQRRFGQGPGSIVPDVLYCNPDGSIAAVRDLKFRCPKGVKTTAQDREQMNRYRARLRINPQIIQPR